MAGGRVRRNGLLVKAAGTVGVIAAAMGATMAPAHAVEAGTSTGHSNPDLPLGNADAAKGYTTNGTDLPTDADAAPKAQLALTARAAMARDVTAQMPAPTGKYQVGVVNLHLVDHHRIDPWVPGNQPRELMVSLWYPATRTTGHALAPWLQSEAANHYLQGLNLWSGQLNLPTTAGHLGAPVNTTAGKLPILIYSTGLHSDRAQGTALVEDLASRGYLVVTVDHTHDANEVQFPDGDLETNQMPAGTHSSYTLSVRAADVHFVINQLSAISKGYDPDADHAALPVGLRGNLDMTRIGMFGWSLGGAAVATSMQLDSRIDAGADLDGQFFGSATSKDLNRPFLLFSSQYHNRNDDSSWATFWSHLHGPRWDIKLAGAQHLSFSDNEYLITQAAGVLGLSPTQVKQEFGTIAPSRAIQIQRTYLAAYFDQELRQVHSPLLDGPSSSFPEIGFVR